MEKKTEEGHDPSHSTYIFCLLLDVSIDSKAVKKGVQTEMREDAEKLTKNIHEQLEHTCLKDITVVIHIIAATKSMGAKELLIEMVRMRHFYFIFWVGI